MAYTSYFASNSGNTKAQANTSGNSTGAGGKGGYKSFFGTQVTSAPTSDELVQRRKKKKDEEQAQQVKTQAAAKQAEIAKPKPKSLISKVGSVAKSVGNSAIAGERVAATGVARVLPGGTADLDAQRKQAESATKNIATATKFKPEIRKKVTEANTQSADQASKQQKDTIKAMPSKKKLAVGFASTAADIVTAGTLNKGAAGFKGRKALKPFIAAAGKKKIAAEIAGGVAANGASGGLNAAAAGGDKVEVAKNFALGAALPGVLHEGSRLTVKAANKAADTKVGKTLINNAQKPAAVLGRDKATNELITNTRASSLLGAKQAPTINAKVNEQHVADGLVEPTVKQTKISEINIDASTRSKIDNKKVSQYEKQIKDGETIEPVVVQDVGGKTVVVDGEHRLEAARKLGITDVPTVKKVEGALPTSTPAGVVQTPPLRESQPTALQAKAETAPVIAKTGPLPDDTPVRLKPTQTAHMESVGGYTHSDHMVNDYADMLRTQEKQVQGGQMKSDGEGGYTRTSDHSPYYRAFFKENKRAPTKADYAEQARLELESGKDAIGAGTDYKKLVERESKPVERMKVASTVVPAEQGTSKVGNSVLESAVGKSLKKKYGEAASYDKINIADQAKKAVAVTEDRQLLDDIISGKAELPNGLRATALIDAVEKHPELGKDVDLLLKLSKSPLASESSYSAQELRLAAERIDSSPITAIKKVAKDRAAAVESKTGKSVAKATDDEVKAIRATKPKVTKETWDSFIESIKC